MKVILKKDFENLGKAGDVVQVKNGYARNYLVPRGIALAASERNMRILEEEAKLNARREVKNRREAENKAVELEKISVTAAVPVGEEDKVFGSVTAQDIADLMKEKGFEIDKRRIVLDEPIKALGVYTVPVKLHAEVEGRIRVWVVKQ